MRRINTNSERSNKNSVHIFRKNYDKTHNLLINPPFAIARNDSRACADKMHLCSVKQGGLSSTLHKNSAGS